MEGDYIELERAYLNSGIEPGSELRVSTPEGMKEAQMILAGSESRVHGNAGCSWNCTQKINYWPGSKPYTYKNIRD
jgi:hypothetical protein